MSKLSIIKRNEKRIKLHAKYKSKHDKLVRIANNKIEKDLYNKLDDTVLLYISIFFFPLIVAMKE